MSLCALNVKPNNDGSRLAPDHITEIAKHTEGNSLKEIKKETGCEDDMCILKKIPDQTAQQIAREALKFPTASFDDNHWLNNTEIDNIMSQMRFQFPGFAHGFIHMIDLKSFDPSNKSSFNYNVYPATETDFANEFKCGLIKKSKLPQGEHSYSAKLSTYKDEPLSSYGVVCNTDSSKGGGQHWFVIFISTDQRDPNNTAKPWIRIECFNSAGGGSTDKRFNDFWERQAMNIARATGLRCTYDIISSIQHQREDTGNCGSYSLFYIWSRLQNAHPSEFNISNKKLLDYGMRKFREVCFRLNTDNKFVV